MKLENKTESGIEYAVCNTCTVNLVNLCCARAWWFYYLRLPLITAMRLLAAGHRIDPRDYRVRTEACYECIRFMKTALKEKSRTFRFLNDRINPVFDKMVERLVTEEEVREAKRSARNATHPSHE
jgi:hypothetical protein